MESVPLSLETLAMKVKTLEDANKKIAAEQEKITEKLSELENNQGVVSTELSNIKELCNEIKADVKDLKERPMKRYDTISTAVVQWLILAVLGAVVVLK